MLNSIVQDSLMKPEPKITLVRGNQAGINCRVGTLLFNSLFLFLTDFLTPSNSDSVDLSFALRYNGHVSD